MSAINGTPRIYASPADLSLRERQLLNHLCAGLLNKEMAYEMGISLGTIKEYLSRLYRKIGVHNRTQAAMWAIERCAVVIHS